jgi:hemin uptake protein HemP
MTNRSGSSPTQSDTLRVVELQALMNGAREMHIRHDGKIYVLRLTSNGKLLLTK